MNGPELGPDARIRRLTHRQQELAARLNQLADEVARLRYDYARRLEVLERSDDRDPTSDAGRAWGSARERDD